MSCPHPITHPPKDLLGAISRGDLDRVLSEWDASLWASCTYQDVESPLHRAVEAPRHAEEMSRHLIGLGADIYCRRRKDDATPVALAKSLGRDDLAEDLRNWAMSSGPHWRRDAVREEIIAVVFLFDKAAGIYLTPTDAQMCFRVGGAYDGPMACGPEGALADLEREAPRWASLARRASALRPLFEAMVRGRDFHLERFMRAAPEARIVRWPSRLPS